MIYLASRAPDCVRHVAERARAVVARGGGRGARRVSGGRFARPHAPHVATARRAVALAVLALVLLVPSTAFAEIAYDPLPGTADGFVAPYRFDLMGRMSAAGEVIGRDFAWLTDEQQQYIVDYNGGSNDFVEFANNNVKNLGYEPSPGANALSAVFPFFISSFGRNDVWYFFAESDAVEDAQKAYDLAWDAYLRDNGLGGGGTSVGGSEVVGDNMEFTFVTDYAYYTNQSNVNLSNRWVVINGVRYACFDASDIAKWNSDFPNSSCEQYPEITKLSVPLSLFSRFTNLDDYDFIGVFSPSSGNNSVYVSILALEKGTYTTEYKSTGTTIVIPYLHIITDKSYWHMNLYCTFPSVGNLNYGYVNVSWSQFNPSYEGFPTPGSNTGGIAVSGPVNGGTNEPTYPDPPQPPEIPEPDPPETKPIDDPGITLPPINFPDLVLPDIDYTVQTPTGDDVIPYLKKIIANQEDIAAFLSDALGVLDEDLDNIGEALGEHCNHIQQQMQKQVYWLAQELQDMFDGLEVGISNYLYRVQTKLLQGIGWEFDNLSQDVISWLKRIYSRLGGNGISKPDPTIDPIGFWDWLIKQFSDFFEDLFGKSTDGLSSLFDSLKEFFPFSLPWDILALLGLFVHEPVTPVFDLPMPVPAIVSDSRMYLIHVDCHPWDGTMQIVRGLEFVFFAYYLMRLVPSWFNEIKVTGM